MSDEKRTFKCGKCGEPLVMKNTMFSYMKRTFGHEVPTCPQCGKVYITRELAEGKMAEVEELLEDK